MARKGFLSRLIGIVIGAVMVAAAIVAVFFFQMDRNPPDEPEPIRPLKTMVVGEAMESVGRKYPGKIAPEDEVSLAFQVNGPLIELNVKKGDRVPKDFLLARIDPRDFKHDLDAKRATRLQKKNDMEKFEEAFRAEVATQKEVDDAKSAYDVAVAREKIAAKALKDTYLRAPFAGLVADKFVNNFQNVKAKQKILSLQNITSVKAEVSVPEERVAMQQALKDRVRFVATFDYLPGREFDVKLHEFTTVADPKTQTYLAAFIMPAPKDVNILPGMTVTIHEYVLARKGAKGAGYSLPIDAVSVDGLGVYYVWVLKSGEDDIYTVHRVNVKVGEMMGDKIFVLDGVAKGDRIATAGVHFLQEDQRVTLFKPKGAAKLK